MSTDHEAPPRTEAGGHHEHAPHRRSRLWWALAAASVVGICAGAVAYQRLSPKPAPATAVRASLSVETAPAARADVPVYATGLGTVQAFNTVTVHVRVDGELQKVHFKEGQNVKADDLLAEIDPRPFQAALDQAVAKKAQDEALLANARRDLERYVQLAAKHDVSGQSLDTQRALVAQLDAAAKADAAAIESATVQLGYTRIAAPVSGRVGLRLVDAGNIVHAADTTGLVVITEVQPIAVVFTLPQDLLPALQKAVSAGTAAATALSSNGKDTLDASRALVIDNLIDQTTGMIRVKATFPNADHALWPGQYVKVRVLLDTRKQVITVPSSAVQRGAQGQYAYVVNAQSRLELRWLTVDDIGESVSVIHDGVAPGERVVTTGHYRLKPGILVAVRP